MMAELRMSGASGALPRHGAVDGLFDGAAAGLKNWNNLDNLVKVMVLTIFIAACVFANQGSVSRHAVLVGANNGGQGLDVLRYAETDAEKFADVLRTVGEFPTSQVRVLRQPDSAGLARELAAVKRAAANSRGKSMILFYYSGHSDGESLLLGKSKFPLRQVKTFLDSSGADLRVGVFDACHSGAVTALKGGKAAEPFYFRQGDNVSGQVIIASSSAHQASQESEPLRGAVFTHHWLNGLRGSADVAGSRYVTLHDAYQYAYRKTVETSAMTGAGTQYPSYSFNIQGDGEVRLTNLNRANEGFLFDASCEGSFIIYGGRGGNIAADFVKPRGTEVFIAAPSGRYRIINTAVGNVMTLDTEVRQGTTERVSSAKFDNRVAAAIPMRAKGAEAPRRFETVRRKGLACGIGGGVITSYPAEESGHPALSVSGIYNVLYDLQIAVTARSQPFSGRAAADAGVNFFWEAQDYKVYAGLGPSVMFDYSSNVPKDDKIQYAIRTQIGFASIRSEKLDIQAQVPVILYISENTKIQTGLELTFVFW